MEYIPHAVHALHTPLVNESSHNGSSLMFNMGPSFLHMISYNKNTSRSFKYFYDFNNCVSSFRNENELTPFDLCTNDMQISKLITDKKCVVKVNVYKDKCTCNKCLSHTFLFFGKQSIELKNELIEVLCSEYCKNWNETWIENLLEQMLIIFCCIKNGIVYERLLETACCCAKILLIKQYKMDLLEFKYSYVYFHMVFKDSVGFSRCKRKCEEQNGKNKIKFHFNFGMGTIEQDFIDGFSILSFETIEELNKYSQIESYIFTQKLTAGLYCKKNPCDKGEIREETISLFLSENGNTQNLDNVRIMEKLSNSDTDTVSIGGGCKEWGIIDSAAVQLNFVQEKKPKRVSTRIFESDFMDEFLKNNSESNFCNDSLSSLNMQIECWKIEENNFSWIPDLRDISHDAINLNQYKQESIQSCAFSYNYVPVFHSCDKRNNKFQVCTCKRFSLGMVLYLGKGRPLGKEATENLEILKRNDSSVSCRTAAIAACAVWDGKKGALNRVVVPVVSKSLVNVVQEWEYNIANEKIAQANADREVEVEKVLNDLLDKVCGMNPIHSWEVVPSSEMPKKVRNKPGRKRKSKILRELHKLSASLVDTNALLDLVKNQKCCANDICENDCECENALRFLIDIPSHCEKKSCQGDCVCKDRYEYDENNKELLEEVTSKHQTVISMMDGKNINIATLTEKSKREKRLSTRFKNSVLLDEASLPAAISSYPAKRPRQKKKLHHLNNSTACKEIQVERFNYRNKYTMMRRFDFCAGNIKDKKTLVDIFIWCANHDKYNCLCPSWVCRMKENILIWKPAKIIKYTTNKILSRFEIPQTKGYEVFFYDPQDYSARTFGSPINYSERNRSNIFIAKRKYEQQNEVLSSTNSFIKNKFLIFKPLDIGMDFDEEECGNIDVFKGRCNENVWITPEVQNDDFEDIDVCSDCANDITPISVEGTKHEVDPPTFHKEQNGIVKTYLNPKKICGKNLESELINKRLVTNSKCVQTDTFEEIPGVTTTLEDGKLDSNVKASDLPNEKELNTNVVTGDPLNERKLDTLVEVNSDKYKINTSQLMDQVHLSSQNDIAATPIKDTLSPYQDFINTVKFDPELEHGLLKLKEHPLRNEIYGQDNLPKLSLLCVTPGIGYLPIVQFNQDMLDVQDPVFPEVIHSFKNLQTANIWLNKFLKEFFVFESIQIYLRWVIVKPGIIKLKQSQPFSPAILENSPIIFTKDGGLKFSNREYNSKDVLIEDRNKDCYENKRKFSQLSPECVVDIQGNDGKRRKIHLETFPVSNSHVQKRSTNYVQYPSKKKCMTSSLLRSSSSILINRSISSVGSSPDMINMKPITPEFITNTSQKFSGSKSKLYQITPTGGEYKLVPASLLIPRYLSPNVANHNGNNNNNSLPMFKIVSTPGGTVTGAKIVSYDGRPVIISKNKQAMSNFN